MAYGADVVRRFAFAVPGDLATPTGAYLWPIDGDDCALSHLGWKIAFSSDLGEDLPWPSETTAAQAEGAAAAVPAGR